MCVDLFFANDFVNFFCKNLKKVDEHEEKCCTIYPKRIFNEMSRTNKFSRSFDMAIKDTYKHMRDLLCEISQDLLKAEGGNKAASQRVRTGTVKLEKIAKLYRKESIRTEKASGGTKKAAKKHAKKAAPKAKAHKAKSKKAHKSIARPRALSFKRPSAKLPIRRAFR